MASETEKGVHDDPNFAIICSFLNNYGSLLQFPDITFNALRSYLETSNRKVHRILEDIFIRLLRRWKGRCPVDAWEKVLVSFCYTYSHIDAWELEKFGFQRCSVSAKMRMLKNLLETQFDCNSKFKEKVSDKPIAELRLQPIGRDKNGLTYWFFMDRANNTRVYTEEQDATEESESWQIVAKDKSGIITLINNLKELKEAPDDPSRSVTPSVCGSRCGTPALSSRCGTPANDAVEVKEEVKVEVKQEIKEEKINTDKVKVKPEVIEQAEVKEEVKTEVEVKEEIKQEVKKEEVETQKGKNKEKSEGNVESKQDEEKEENQLVKQAGDDITENVTEESGESKLEETSSKLVEEKSSEMKGAVTDDLTESQKLKDDKSETEAGKNEGETGREETVSSAKGEDLEPDNKEDKEESIITKTVKCKEAETICADGEENLSGTVSANEDVEREKVKLGQSETNKESEEKAKVEAEEASKVCPDLDSNKKEVDDCLPVTCGEESEKKPEDTTVAVDSSVEKGDIENKDETPVEEATSVNDVAEEQEVEPVEEKGTQSEDKAPLRGGRGRRGRRRGAGKNKVVAAVVNEDQCDDKPKQRKRKRGRGGSESETEAHIPEKVAEAEKGAKGAKSSAAAGEAKSESDLPETPPVSGNESKEEECTPSKRRRDKFLKKRKPVKEADSESTDESAEPEKKPKKVDEEGETNVENVKAKDQESTAEEDAGSQKENCPKKCGKRKEDEEEKKEEELKEAPTSKKGRPSSQGRRKKEAVEIPAEALRRSSRATRGVRRFEASTVSDSPRRKRLEKEPKEEVEIEKPREVKQKRKTKKEMEEEKENRDIEKKANRRKKRNAKQTKDIVELKNGKKTRRGRPKKDNTDDEHEEEEEELFHEEEDSEPLHWSSPSETEYENDTDVETYTPKGRNAKRQQRLKSLGEIENNDTPCCKCENYDHPEWILLCDSCDAGYHTGCLRPPLMIIPDDDWFCPPCEHSKLIVLLLERLTDINKISMGTERLDRRRERLKYVGISLGNILTDQEKARSRKRAVIQSSSDDEDTTKDEDGDEGEEGEDPDLYDNGAWETLKEKEKRGKENRQRDIQKKYYYDWGDRYVEKNNSYSDETESTECSSSEEEEYSMVANRSRRERKQINYNFNEFDEIIKTAIKEETECPASRGGKSMKAVIEANNRKYSDEEEEEEEEAEADEEDESWKGQGKDMRNIEAAIAKEKKKEEAFKKDVEKCEGNDVQEEKQVEGPETEEECEAESKRDVFKDRPSHPLVSAKAKRKKNKRLTALSDDDDEENDTDEYKLSEDEASDDVYQEEEDDLSEESVGYKRGSRYGTKSSSRSAGVRRSTRRRRVLKDMSDFVVDEYDSEEEKSNRRGNTRRSTTLRKRYSENFSDEETAESEFYSDDSFDTGRRSKTKKSPTKKSSKKSSSKKRKRKMKYEEKEDDSEADSWQRERKMSARYEEDSDYNLSDESGYRGGRRRAASKRINYREMVGSGSEADAPKKKKKGKLDMSKFVKSESNEESNTDEYVEENHASSDGTVSEESGPRVKVKTEDSEGSDGLVSRNRKPTAKKRSRIQAVEYSSEEEEEENEEAGDEEEGDLEKKGRGHNKKKQQQSAINEETSDSVVSDITERKGETREIRSGSVVSSVDIKNTDPVPNPMTYVFKARVNGCDNDNNKLTSSRNESNNVTTTKKSPPKGEQTAITNGSEEDSNTDVDCDDLEDIGDIVDYITQDGGGVVL